jgi:hypothetical protein
VTEAPSFDVVCPHCKKSFSAELLGDGSARQRGFKCPHCKLFVPAERTETEEPTAP